MKLSQSKRDPNTRAYKWIYHYNGVSFRGENSLLNYLNNQGFKIGTTCLNNILNGNENAKYYKELYGKITKERNKEFNYKNDIID